MKKYIVPATFLSTLDIETSLMTTSFVVDPGTTIVPGTDETDGNTGQLTREFDWSPQNWED